MAFVTLKSSAEQPDIAFLPLDQVVNDSEQGALQVDVPLAASTGISAAWRSSRRACFWAQCLFSDPRQNPSLRPRRRNRSRAKPSGPCAMLPE